MNLNQCKKSLFAAAMLALSSSTFAEVTAEEAAKLKTTLTPVGAERAGNKDGSIPEWSGGFKGAYNYSGGRRPDPFAGEKPLFTINAKNVDQYADKLSDGTKALFKKYPNYRLDVYKTQRTAMLPQVIYDRTFASATKTKLVPSPGGPMPEGFMGGVPFPMPKSGEEAIWNHLMRFRGMGDLVFQAKNYLRTADGKLVLLSDVEVTSRTPNNAKDFKPESWTGAIEDLRLITRGPSIRAGEQIAATTFVDAEKSYSYAYVPGQRRVRRLPNACCDTPSLPMAGVGNVDDTSVFYGRIDRFKWKLLDKKEIYIPYNSNMTLVPAEDKTLLGEKFVNPDLVRWELHRVWLVEADLAPNQRHTSPKNIFYLDEDTWIAVMGDRWDAKSQLWKTSFVIPFVVPDQQQIGAVTNVLYDLQAGTSLIANVLNEKPVQLKYVPPQPDSIYSPESMAATGVR